MCNFGYNTITDYQRMQNQKTVIEAVYERLLRPANLANIPEFITIFNENVQTDLGIRHIAWFAQQLNHMGGADSVNMHTLPTTGTSGYPMYYEFLDPEAVMELINETVNPFNADLELIDFDIICEETYMGW